MGRLHRNRWTSEMGGQVVSEMPFVRRDHPFGRDSNLKPAPPIAITAALEWQMATGKFSRSVGMVDDASDRPQGGWLDLRLEPACASNGGKRSQVVIKERIAQPKRHP
jgi:hypothetical protein